MMPLEASRMVITVGGLHGTGKSTYVRGLSSIFGLRHISAGDFFRSIAQERGMDLNQLSLAAQHDEEIDKAVDARTLDEASRGGVIIDGQIAAWIAASKAHIKLLLLASDEIRCRRIAERDGLSMEEARRVTLEREATEHKRFKRYYNINISDQSIYDAALNTELLPLKSNMYILTQIVNEYLNAKGSR